MDDTYPLLEGYDRHCCKIGLEPIPFYPLRESRFLNLSYLSKILKENSGAGIIIVIPEFAAIKPFWDKLDSRFNISEVSDSTSVALALNMIFAYNEGSLDILFLSKSIAMADWHTYRPTKFIVCCPNMNLREWMYLLSHRKAKNET